MAPKEGVWGGKLVVIGLNHYWNFSANNVEEQPAGDIHMKTKTCPLYLFMQ